MVILQKKLIIRDILPKKLLKFLNVTLVFTADEIKRLSRRTVE